MIPPRAPGVPDGARYVAEPVPHWHHGALEVPSGQPVGAQTYYTLHGEPMRHERYDARGRLLSRRSSLQRDWAAAHVERFQEEADRFHWYPFVGRLDDETRAAIERAARGGTPAHRLSYAQALAFVDQRRARTADVTFPRADRVLALFRETVGAIEPAEALAADADADTVALVALALDAMLTVGDDAELARWGPPWLAATRPARARDRLPKDLEDRVRAALEGRWASGAVLRARRALRTVVIPVLGVPDRTPLLLVDAEDRAYWLEEDAVQPAPLEVDATGPSLARWFAGARPLSSRELTVDPGRGFWLAQRYGRDLLLFGGARDQATLAVEPVVDLFVRCPDDGWADRVASLFAATRPFAPVAADAFVDAGAAWIREYRGDVDHLHARDVRWLGVVGGELVGAAAPAPRPSVIDPRERRRAPPAPQRRAEARDHAAAISTFESEERALFERGYFLAYLHRVGGP